MSTESRNIPRVALSRQEAAESLGMSLDPAEGTSGRVADSVSRLLEAEDVAKFLGMRTDWVYREVRAGRLPHIRLGRAVRFRRESIEAWVDSRERGASSRRRS